MCGGLIQRSFGETRWGSCGSIKMHGSSLSKKAIWGTESCYHMSYSLNSLKGGYIGDYIWDY